MADVRQMGSLALVIVVSAMILGLGSSILNGLSVNDCPYTFVTNVTPATGAVSVVNPVTGVNYGCCTTLNPAGTNNCTTWYTASASINASAKGMTGLATFGNWLPLIALVLVAAVVISVIVRYMGGIGGGV